MQKKAFDKIQCPWVFMEGGKKAFRNLGIEGNNFKLTMVIHEKPTAHVILLDVF